MAWSRGGGEGRFLTFLVSSSRVQSSPGMSLGSLIHLRTSVTVFHLESRHCEDCPTKKLADLSRNSSSRFILFSFRFSIFFFRFLLFRTARAINLPKYSETYLFITKIISTKLFLFVYLSTDETDKL